MSRLDCSAIGLLCVAVGACRGEPAPAQVAAKPDAVVAAPDKTATSSSPPVFTFVPPKAWQPRGGGDAVPPPDLSQETWRIMANQTEPMQYKNPRWQPLPAAETVEIEMPPGSRFRCVVPPLQMVGTGNDFQTAFEAWNLKRSFLCSNDGFRSWSETTVQVRIAADGKRIERGEGGLLLRERDADSTKVRESYVLMRTDKEKTQATVGPPQVLTGRSANED